MFNQRILALCILFGICAFHNATASAQEPAEISYVRARVESVSEAVSDEGVEQDVWLTLQSGPEKGKKIRMTNDVQAKREDRYLHEGEKIIVQRILREDGSEMYDLQEKYRMSGLAVLGVLFLGASVVIGRRRGFMAILGLIVSAIVIVAVLFPLLVSGFPPFLTTIIVTFLIAGSTLFISHGWNTRTLLAFAAICITLVCSVLLAVIAVHLTKLYGFGSEESVFLFLDATINVDIRGLFLAGILIGALGVLDDITTAQVAAVYEVSKANPRYGVGRLYRAGCSVGYEHIASMINTLVLAYVGASLPLFLLLFVSEGTPMWVIVNGAFLVEEIVRTVVGSMALLLAVPVSTWLAARTFGQGFLFAKNLH